MEKGKGFQIENAAELQALVASAEDTGYTNRINGLSTFISTYNRMMASMSSRPSSPNKPLKKGANGKSPRSTRPPKKSDVPEIAAVTKKNILSKIVVPVKTPDSAPVIIDTVNIRANNVEEFRKEMEKFGKAVVKKESADQFQRNMDTFGGALRGANSVMMMG